MYKNQEEVNDHLTEAVRAVMYHNASGDSYAQIDHAFQQHPHLLAWAKECKRTGITIWDTKRLADREKEQRIEDAFFAAEKADLECMEKNDALMKAGAKKQGPSADKAIEAEKFFSNLTPKQREQYV